MANIFSYLRKYRGVSFTSENLTILDALVLTGIVYLPIPKRPTNELKEEDELLYLIKKFIDHPTAYKKCVMPSTELKFARTIIRCTRFNNIKMYGFVESIDSIEQKQFRACTYIKDDFKQIFIAFCGTDTTLVGWKEDFNMSFEKETPSQKLAIQYLENIAAKFPDTKIYIGGHSKGGNLAIHSALLAKKEVQDRIQYVFNFDGPGIQNEDTYHSESYNRMMNKIITIVPSYSMVGILFYPTKDFRIIHSSGVGIYNHAFYFWNTKDKDFYYAKRISRMSAKTSVVTKNAMKELSSKDREIFMDNFYALLTASGAKTTHAIVKDIFRALEGASDAFSNMDHETQDKMLNIFSKWISVYFRPMNAQEKAERKKIESLANKK